MGTKRPKSLVLYIMIIRSADLGFSAAIVKQISPPLKIEEKSKNQNNVICFSPDANRKNTIRRLWLISNCQCIVFKTCNIFSKSGFQII